MVLCIENKYRFCGSKLCWQWYYYRGLFYIKKNHNIIWKTIEGIAPNIGTVAFTSNRHGRLCRIPNIKTHAPRAIQTIREESLQVRGPKLFNSLPPDIRNITGCSTNCFKNKLDNYLKNIPDHPKIPGFVTQNETNSITNLKFYLLKAISQES